MSRALSARSLVLAILIALAAVGLARLSLDVEVLNLLPGDNPVSRGLLTYQERFLNAGELVVTVQGENADAAAESVTAIVSHFRDRTNLVERFFWQPPWNDSIAASAQFLAYLWLNAPPDKVLALNDSLKANSLEATLAATREKMTTSLDPRAFMFLPRDPFHLSSISSESSDTFQTPERFFGSEDGLFRIIYMYSAVPVQDYDQCHTWVKAMRAELQTALRLGGTDQNVSVRLTGRPVFVDEIASGMKSDLSTNVPGTLLMIGLLFFIVHREVRSLILLLVTLLVVMVWTALLGGALLSQLNVISIGFASILLGLAEDFGIVLHQEAKSHPNATPSQLRGIAGAGIFWSAITTASAFALLNFSSLPGLRQLGTLVAVGILLGAWVMSYLFLPLLLRYTRRSSVAARNTNYPESGSSPSPMAARVLTVALLLAGIGVAGFRFPSLSASPDVLRPRKSEASRTLAAVQENLGVAVEPYWVLAGGKTIAEVEQTLDQLDPELQKAVNRGAISSYNLPREIWPHPQWQQSNAPVLHAIADREAELKRYALASGFTTNSLELTETVLHQWRSYSPTNLVWPEGRIADWLLPKFVSRTATNFTALGLLYPTPQFSLQEVLPDELQSRAIVSGWRLLGQQVLEHVKREVPLISLGVLLVVTVALYLTFRTWIDVALSFGVLLLSGVLLLAGMSLLRWEWNLINLTSLPLLLGMGIDYSIHIQLALKRLAHNRHAVFHSVGRALLLAGSTSIIGFALLGTSSNLGMSSLGKVCALGLTLLLLVSVFLLPSWTPRRWSK